MRWSESLKMFFPILTTASYNSDDYINYINKGAEHFCLSFLLYNGKMPYDGAFHLLFRLKKAPNTENIVWVSCQRFRRSKLVLLHVIRGSDGAN